MWAVLLKAWDNKTCRYIKPDLRRFLKTLETVGARKNTQLAQGKTPE
jgi:hypothetical protein